MKKKIERQFNANTPVKPLTLEATGKIKILEMEINGIVSSRIRHLIKRYIKKTGFMFTKVTHTSGTSPFSVNLIVIGYITEPITNTHIQRIEYLKDALTAVLSITQNGQTIHPSHADDEQLRFILSKEEPALMRVYYKQHKKMKQNDDSNT